MELYERRRVRISIHIPRVGDDWEDVDREKEYDRFQSTSPVWGMTIYFALIFFSVFISIHIPRVGDDPRCGALKVPPL